MEFSESDVIAQFAEVFTRPDSRVVVGIGDDAAVITTSHRTVVTTDMAVEGVHFRRDWSSPFDIGRKITAANLADVFAVGGTPDHLVVAVSLTGRESLEWIKELAVGIDQEARKCSTTVVGGDVVRGSSITISITALGRVGTPILRSGAKVGDGIFLSSLPGWSAAGLHLLVNEIDMNSLRFSDHAQRALTQYRAPIVNYDDAIGFRGAHSMCDISDGLLIQGGQLADASKVKFTLHSDVIQGHVEFKQMKDLANEIGADPWDWVAAGGEDHVFLATGAKLRGFRIGDVESGNGIEIEGLASQPRGFEHFS